jgi:hypothetical protein
MSDKQPVSGRESQKKTLFGGSAVVRGDGCWRLWNAGEIDRLFPGAVQRDPL